MNPDRYIVRFISIRELVSFTKDYLKNMSEEDILPITLHKAESIAQNPCAVPEDIALVLAYHHTKCIGYLGLIVNRLKIGTDMHKIYWMSPWYVHSEYRGKSVGSLLIQEAKKLNVPICSIHPLRGAYRKNQFVELPTVCYHQIEFDRLNFFSLFLKRIRKNTTKNRVIASLVNFLILISDVLYIPIHAGLQRLLRTSLHRTIEDLYFEQTNALRPLFPNTISEGFYREADAINWMIKHPWIIQEKKNVYRNYHFSHSRSVFTYIAYNIYSDSSKEKHIGGVVFSITEINQKTILKICDTIGVGVEKSIEKMTIKMALKYKADTIVCRSTFFNNDSFIVQALKRKQQREAVVWNPPKRNSNHQAISVRNVITRFSDGDQAFY